MPNPLVVFVNTDKFETAVPTGWAGGEQADPCACAAAFDVIFLPDNCEDSVVASLLHTNRRDDEILPVVEHGTCPLSKEKRQALTTMGLPSIAQFSHVPENEIFQILLRILVPAPESHAVQELMYYVTAGGIFKFYSDCAAEINIMILNGTFGKMGDVIPPLSCVGFFRDWNTRLTHNPTLETARGIMNTLFSLSTQVEA